MWGATASTETVATSVKAEKKKRQSRSRTIAANFHTIILRGIPQLGSEKRNEAARFVALIDALYEAKIKLVASAAAEPETLYPEGDGAFEFERTVSRLHEMRSTDYLAEERVEISVD
ncbi:MAG: AFG1/ZapE family ATPase [Hyphomonas sp.]